MTDPADANHDGKVTPAERQAYESVAGGASGTDYNTLLQQRQQEWQQSGGVGGVGFGMPTAMSAGSAITPERTEWRVYLGKDTVPRLEPGQVDSTEGGRFVRQRGTVKVPDVTTTDKAANLWYTWSDEDRKAWVDYLVEHGVLDREDPDLYPKAAQGWSDAVEEAGNYFTLSNGKNKVTPWQVVGLYSGANKPDNGVTRGTTTESVHIDDLDARAAAEEAYSALMGRSPKGKEVHAIKAMLQAYADNHPVITREVRRENAKGNVHTSRETTGGVSDAAAKHLVTDQVRSNPGYAEYQASTTVMNWLLDALGPTVEGV